MTRNERLQGLIRLYKEKTGNRIIDMDAVTEWSLTQGVAMPKPKTPRELFAAQLSDAARAEFRRDAKTGLSYRANHAMRTTDKDGRQYTLWFDIEDATRPQMLVSLQSRRQQMVGDAVHLKIDEMVWNSKNPDQKPIQLVMDFEDDVEERLNSPDFGSGTVAA